MYRGTRVRAALFDGHGPLPVTVPSCSAAAWPLMFAPPFERRHVTRAIIASFVLLLHAFAAREFLQHVPHDTPRVERDPLTVEFALPPATKLAQVAPAPARDEAEHQAMLPARAEIAHPPALRARSARNVAGSRQPATLAHTQPAATAPQRPVDRSAEHPTTSAPAKSSHEEPPAVPAAPSDEPAPQPVTPASFAAAYLHNPAPEYPAQAQERGWQGTVLLRAHVLSSGRVNQVEIVASSGHDILDTSAVEAVTNWRFAPARRGETAIDTWVRIPVNFKQ
jgi:protein TonB